MAESSGRFNFLPKGGRDGIFIVLSILVAAIVWLLTNLSNDYSAVVSVPVVAQCSIDGHSARSSNHAVVTARCRTDGFHLLSFRSRKERRSILVNLDRSDLRYGGADTYYLTSPAINNYAGHFFGDETLVEAFITDTLSFVFPAENHRKVPVTPSVSVNYRSQYMGASPLKVKPDSVTVYGEAARLDVIDHVSTPHLNLWDVHEPIHGTLKLSTVKGVRYSVNEVSYEVDATRFVELRSKVPVEVWNVPAGHHVQVLPPVAEVVIRCSFPVGRDPFSQFKLYIDYADFNASLSGRLVPRALRLPSGVLDYRLEPEIFACIEDNG